MIIARRGLTPQEWRSLSDADKDDLLAWQAHVERELDALLETLTKQEANSPEVVTVITLAKLGL